MLKPRHSVQLEAVQCVEFLGSATSQEPPQPTIGLSGMRAPTSSHETSHSNKSTHEPVKSPIGEVKPAAPSVTSRPIKKLGTPEIQPLTEEIVPETEIVDTITGEISDTDELVQEPTTDDNSEIGTLRPITKTMIPQQQPRTTIAKLTPVKHMLEPEQKSREGAPPPKDLGRKIPTTMSDFGAN